ncbi:MAG: MBL fold metallo-hydrolase [Gemmatimonadota bacterium]
MKLTFLGTGTSFGIPVIGCACRVCRSDDPRDRRTRHGALLTFEEGRILVDTPPELRLQLVREGVESLTAVWFTHPHADHLHGIDDLRIFTSIQQQDLPAFVPVGYEDTLRRRFRYIFDESVTVPDGTVKPEIRLRPYGPGEELAILGRTFHPVRVPHGPLSVFGFRVGGLGYVTDGKSLPPETLEVLDGVDVLVLNALWFGDPHPTHFNVEEAVEAAGRVGARRTYLTHLTHQVGHRELLRELPEGIEPAYDGLEVEISEKCR